MIRFLGILLLVATISFSAFGAVGCGAADSNVKKSGTESGTIDGRVNGGGQTGDGLVDAETGEQMSDEKADKLSTSLLSHVFEDWQVESILKELKKYNTGRVEVVSKQTVGSDGNTAEVRTERGKYLVSFEGGDVKIEDLYVATYVGGGFE